MRLKVVSVGLSLVAVALTCGCGTSYSWRSVVPKAMRTVVVPTFRNESDIAELGAVSTRQVLREIQREGTFSIRREGEAALEIQGVIKSANTGVSGYDRSSGMRMASYDLTAIAEVSVIDKRRRTVLIDNRKYTAHATFTAGQDLTTAKRDASGRLAEDLARQVVDDILLINWSKSENE